MTHATVKNHQSLAFILGIFFIGGVTANECKNEFGTINKGELTVTSAVTPPLVFKSGNQSTGIDFEIISKLAEEQCLKINHIFTDAPAAIQYVVAGRSDVSVGGWYRTAERAKVLGVSDPVYLEETAIYSRDGFTKFSQLDGKRVGTVTGYLWVPELKKIYGNKLSLYPTAVALIQDLSNNRIDAAVNSYATGIEGQKQGALAEEVKVNIADPDPRVKSSVYPAQSAFLYNKNNAQLGEAINELVSRMRESGEISEILVRYGLKSESAIINEPRFADQ